MPGNSTGNQIGKSSENLSGKGPGLMSGKFVIISMFLAAIIMSVFFYRTLKMSSGFRDLAADQMKKEFLAYTKDFKKIDSLEISREEEGTRFFLPIKEEWGFLIQDQTLVVSPTPVQSEPAGQLPRPETFVAADQAVQNLVLIWLKEKFKNQKDLSVEVRWRTQNRTSE